MRNDSYWTRLPAFAATALGAVLMLPQTAAAGWTEVSDLSQPVGLVDADSCDFRLHYVDGHNDLHRDYYFPLEQILQFRDDSGAAYSQDLRFQISYRNLSSLRFGGALSQSSYDTLADHYRHSIPPPFDLSVSLIVGGGWDQLSLTYYWYNEAQGGAVYATSTRLEKGPMALEALCQTLPATVLDVVSAAASSSYSSSFGPEKMIDGQEATYWIGAPSQASYTVTLDLGQQRQLDQLELSWYSASYAARDFDVATSGDGDTWDTIATGLDAATRVECEGQAAARYLRITMYSVDASFPVIREARVIGR